MTTMAEGDTVNPLDNWTPDQGVMTQSADAQIRILAAQKQMEQESKVSQERAVKTYDAGLKIEALHQAIARTGSPATAKLIVEDARLFYKFLSGAEQTVL